MTKKNLLCWGGILFFMMSALCGCERSGQEKEPELSGSPKTGEEQPVKMTQPGESKRQAAWDLQHKGDTKGAIRILAGIVKEYPDDVGTLADLGYIYIQAGNFVSAHKVLDTAIKLNPKCGPALKTKGLAYFKEGKYKPAEKYLLKALPVSPRDVEVYSLLSKLYLTQGENSKAKDHLKRAIKIAPDRPRLKMQLKEIESR